MSRTNSLLRDLLKAARWHRRLLAGVSAAAAVYFGLVALTPQPIPTVAVLGAARDLAGGAVPATADLQILRLPAEVVPAGALRPGTDLVKRVLAVPVRSGEPLTDVRFVSPGLSGRPGDGLLAYPVRLDDAEVVALLRVGDRIDLYAATSSHSATAGQLADAVRVIALPAPSRGNGSPGSAGALVMIAATPDTVARIAQAVASSRLTVALTQDTG